MAKDRGADRTSRSVRLRRQRVVSEDVDRIDLPSRVRMTNSSFAAEANPAHRSRMTPRLSIKSVVGSCTIPYACANAL